MRQGSKRVTAKVQAKSHVPSTARRPSKTKVQASPLVAKKAPKRESPEPGESNKRLAEALQRQAATDEILRVMSNSPGDVHPVLYAVAERAARLCDAFFAQVLLVEGNVLRPTVAYWADAPLSKRDDGPGPVKRSLPLKKSVIGGRSVVDCMTIHHADAAPLMETEYPDSRTKQQELGYRAVLAVPLLREGGASGVIFMFRREPRAFSPDQVALVETFAKQAAIAIDNARRFREANEALEQQTATSEILRVIAGSPADLQPMLSAVVERAAKLCEAANATIFLVDGDSYRSAARFGGAKRPFELGQSIPLTRGSAAGRAILERTTIHLEDLAVASEDEYPVALQWQRVVGHHTVLAVPLMREDCAIGAFSLFRMEVRPFTDKQISLVKTFADQAAIAIENVRLFNETKEALEQQTATSDILRVISSSPTDVRPVFDAIAASALKLCSANSASVFTFDGQMMEVAATARLDSTAKDVDDIRRFFPRPPSRDMAATRAVLTGSTVVIPDVIEDSEYVYGTTALASNFRSVLAVPLIRDGSPIGAIAVGRPEPGPFPDKQIALLRTFANQAVIAIENVRLFNETKQALERQTATSEILRVISRSTRDVQPVFDTIVQRAVRLCEARYGAVFRMERGLVHLAAHYNLSEKLLALWFHTFYPMAPDKGHVSGRVILTGTAVQVPDVLADNEYRGAGMAVSGFRSLLGVPLLHDGAAIGAIVIYRREPGRFEDTHIELLQTFANQAVIAIQNARFLRELEQKSRELEAASRHKSEFLANMSHELRTPLNAIIGFSEVLSERMFGEINEKQAEYVGDILDSGQHLLSLINDILDLSKIEAGRMELEPTEFDLPSTIDQTVTLVRERAVRRGITLARVIDERLGSIRADERKVKQVLLNLLSNALKFTPEGGKIDVRAAVRDDVAEISVMDTGIGISPEDQEAVFEEFRQVGTASKKVEGTGLGLAISKKFVELHGGRIWVTSKVGAGSTFAFTLPL